MFAQVIVDITHSKVDRVFDYKINNDTEIALGRRVLVPFGVSNKLLEGFVIGVSKISEYDINKVKPINCTLEEYPVLHKDQIDLAFYMREKYGCTLADAFRLMLPGRLHGSREKKRYTARIISDDISALFTKGGKEKAPLQIRVYEYLKSHGESFITDIEDEINGCSSAVTGLKNKGIVEVTPKEVIRKPYVNAGIDAKKITLNSQQKLAVDTVCKDMFSGERYLLHGITGSGKTEVYMRLVEHCLDHGKGAIILVPEISLTPQAVERYRAKFGDSVALLHSRLSQGERFDEWKQILTGKCSVVLGPRSAVFAPVNNLGLIIVDEEHEGTYISDSFPRYDARDLAKFRISNEGCLLLGSATPSVETYYSAGVGEYKLLEINRRANSMPLPDTNVVDMAKELMAGNKTIISNFLFEAIKDRLDKEEQVILLLNKRGYASFVMCRGCGHVLKCPHCDVSLAYHRHDGSRVKCHYCNYEQRVSRICPECGKPFMKYFGVGTQQVEEQINKLFPKAKTLRMDFDTTRKKDSHYDIFNSFINRKADILIGTQMIAKGLDFPAVTLVGIICADNMFNLPDYRAKERAFALITQASGRAGRDKVKGEVVIQTYIKDNPTLAYAIRQDYKGFYAYEISARKKTDYPPFAIFCRVIISSASNEDSFEVTKELNRLVFDKVNCLGTNKLLYSCSPCPIGLLKDMYRYQILMKLKEGEESQKFIKGLGIFLRNYETDKKVYVDFEINPKNIL